MLPCAGAGPADVLVTGGTGTGKTTLLGALLGVVAAGERLILAEDCGVLRPAIRRWCGLQTRPPNSRARGDVVLRDLVRQALRMRPDRLVVGEVRGAEPCDLLAAMNTGHEGGCGTVHANSVAHVPVRLEVLAALVTPRPTGTACPAGTAALDVVVHIRRGRDGASTGQRSCTSSNATP